jgi:predicted nucleic acid-binding protein
VIFVDTSGFYALLDRNDRAHLGARDSWTELLSAKAPETLVTSNYVLVECYALIQSRLGLDAVRTFHGELLPVVTREWVTELDHAAAVNALLTAGRRHLSLVDCSSFQLMRRLVVKRAFAIDRHFAEQGVELLPGT